MSDAPEAAHAQTDETTATVQPRVGHRALDRQLATSRNKLAADAAPTPEHVQDVRDLAVRQNVEWLSRVSSYQVYGITALGLVMIAEILFLGRHGQTSKHGSAIAATIITGLILMGLICLRRKQGGLLDYIRGGDNRLSTSQAQAGMWTIVVVWAVLYFALRLLTGLDYGKFTTAFSQLDGNYLILLGGPFAAAVLAKLATQSKTTDGTAQKAKAAGPQIRDLTTDDNGDPDLVDTQFVVFNIAAVFVFAVLLYKDPDNLPSLPATLIGLTSVSALTYVGNKAVTTNPPTILSIVLATPERTGSTVSPGSTVEIRGANLLPPGTADAEMKAKTRVTFGTLTTPVDVTSITDSLITTVVPDLDTATRSVDVTVTTAAGVTTPKFVLGIAPPKTGHVRQT